MVKIIKVLIIVSFGFMVLGQGTLAVHAEVDSTILDLFEAVNENKAMINGHIWNVLSITQKRIYLQGYNDALQTTEMYSISNEGNITSDLEEEMHLFSNMSIDELIKKIEAFYSDHDNLDIPISYALLIARNQLKGYSKEALTEYTKYLRRVFTSVPDVGEEP